MEKPRIQDDLFNYVNHEWTEESSIPSDQPATNAFYEISVKVEEKLISDFNEMLESKNYPNKNMENACNLFRMAKDVNKRNKDGIKPALKFLNKKSKIVTLSQFNRNLKELLLDDYPLPFSMDVESDMMDTNKHMLLLMGPNTILPDSAYYKPGMENQKEMMLQLWKGMASAILSETKLTKEEQELYLNDTLSFDNKIGGLVKTRAELVEYAKLYNPMSLRRVCTLLKPIKFKKLVLNLFGQELETICVGDVNFLKQFKNLFNEETFTEYTHWAYVQTLLSSTSLLSEHLREVGGSFSRGLMGVSEMENVDKYSYNLVSSIYSEPVGIYYGEKYFGEKAKEDVIELVQEIINKYKERIQKNDFLSNETKAKAIVKLDKIGVRMGYPDKVQECFNLLTFDYDDNLFNACKSLSRIYKEYRYSELLKPVDRTRWIMPGHMVNACYHPFTNTITFPAAILQEPFYSINQSRSQNLGGIGAVIGHEISHAFDNNGAKFDEFGNLHNWWTKEDFKKFDAKTKLMIKEFDGIELPWGKVNASFTVSENIADNGGVAVTLDIMKDNKDSNYEEYFLTWGRIWRHKAQTEYLTLLLQLDEHSPAILRANMPPRNFDEWYDTFKVTKDDGMYLDPKRRVVIW